MNNHERPSNSIVFIIWWIVISINLHYLMACARETSSHNVMFNFMMTIQLDIKKRVTTAALSNFWKPAFDRKSLVYFICYWKNVNISNDVFNTKLFGETLVAGTKKRKMCWEGTKFSASKQIPHKDHRDSYCSWSRNSCPISKFAFMTNISPNMTVPVEAMVSLPGVHSWFSKNQLPVVVIGTVTVFW